MRVAQLGVLCFHLLAVDHVHCVEMSWTQYSDRASLPLALHAREKLRSTLDRLQMEDLSAEEKAEAIKLKRLLDEVIAESLEEAEADARRPGLMRLKRLLASDYLRPDRLGLLALLLVLGGGFLKLNSTMQASAAAKAAAEEADRMMEAEQLESRTIVLQAVKGGEVFPGEVAESLCNRIISVLNSQTKKKSGKKAKSRAPLIMNSRQLGQQLAQHYDLPEATIVDKALRKEKKKLKTAAKAIDAEVSNAKEAQQKAAFDAMFRRDTAESASGGTQAKKGPKNAKKAQAEEDATRLADEAEKAAATRAGDLEKAELAARLAWERHDRPDTLARMEGAWLGAVLQTWVQHAATLGGDPTPSHMHAWARDETLRQRTDALYVEEVSATSFLE